MVKENMSKVQKLTVSAMVMALYVVVLYFTQSFSFGAYQIRIATALYALAYLFPFLMILPIILVPGLGVPSYLSYLLHVPYSVLATSLCIGQSVPAVCGVVLVNVLQRALYPKATKA